MYAWVCTRIGVGRMTGRLLRCAGAELVAPGPGSWAVTRQSTSAVELLRSALRRRVIVRSPRHHDFLAGVPLEQPRMLGDVEAVALDEHLLIDGEPPHSTPGLSLAPVVPGRLPVSVRPAFDRHGQTIAELHDAAGSLRTAEALEVEQLAASDPSLPSERLPDTRMLRLTRRLSVIGTPVPERPGQHPGAATVQEEHGAEAGGALTHP